MMLLTKMDHLLLFRKQNHTTLRKKNNWHEKFFDKDLHFSTKENGIIKHVGKKDLYFL